MTGKSERRLVVPGWRAGGAAVRSAQRSCASVRSASSGKGTSLLELLVALGLGLGVLAIVASGMVTHLRLAREVREQAARVEDLAWVARVFARDMREAGLDPALAGLPAMGDATRSGLLRFADRDADGVLAERSGEHVAYSVSIDGRLSRHLGRQPMSILHGLVPGGTVFRFFDHEGRLIAGEASALDDEARKRIARVELELVGSGRGGESASRLRFRSVAALRARIDTEMDAAGLPARPAAPGDGGLR